MRQEPKLFSSDRGTPPPQDGFHVEPRQAPRARYDDDDDRPRRARGGFPWKLVIALAVLVAVSYGGWKVWGLLGQQVAGGGEVPLFTASVDPFKHRPDDPGGIVVPYENSTVFGGTLGGAEQGDELEVLLPEPEEPVAMQPDEATVPIAAEDGVVDVGTAPVGNLTAPEEGAQALFSADQIDALVDQALQGGEDALPLPQEKPAAPAAPETTISVVEAAAATTTAEAAAPSSGGTGTLSLDDIAASLGVGGNAATATPPSTATETPTQTPAAEQTTAAAVETAQPTASGGASWVQIAAYLSREDAAAAWQRLAANQADLLASVEARVMETTVAGTSFHRLQVGSFASAADAQRLCDALRQRQIDCMVVDP